MAQFQAEVPGPLRQNKPELLAPGRMRTPAIHLLFFVFIRRYGLKRATMEIQSHYISRGKRAGWQGGVEQLVDVFPARGADFRWPICGRMRGNDDPRVRSGW